MSLATRQREMQERMGRALAGKLTARLFNNRKKKRGPKSVDKRIHLPVYLEDHSSCPISEHGRNMQSKSREKINKMMELSEKIPVSISPISIQQSTMGMFDRE